MSKNAYAKAGVDVEAGYKVVDRIKKHAEKRRDKAFLVDLEALGQPLIFQALMLRNLCLSLEQTV